MNIKSAKLKLIDNTFAFKAETFTTPVLIPPTDPRTVNCSSEHVVCIPIGNEQRTTHFVFDASEHLKQWAEDNNIGDIDIGVEYRIMKTTYSAITSNGPEIQVYWCTLTFTNDHDTILFKLFMEK